MGCIVGGGCSRGWEWGHGRGRGTWHRVMKGTGERGRGEGDMTGKGDIGETWGVVGEGDLVGDGTW